MAKGTDKTDVETGNSKEDMEPIMKKPKFKDDLKASSQAHRVRQNGDQHDR